RFNEASLPSADRSRLIEEAKQISAARKQVYLLEYQQDLDAWNWSEEQKLAKTFEIEKARVDAKVGMSKEERALRKKSLDEQRDDELKSLRLSQEQQLFQIEESYMDEAKALARRYELERQEIEKVRDAKIRAGLLNASARAEDNEYESRRRDAFQNYQAMSASMSGVQEYYNLDKELEDRRKTIDDALKWNNISEEEARQANLAAEKDYLLKRAKLNSYYGEQITGSMVDMLETAGDKQSGIYKAMFAANKAFAIAQSLVAIQQGVAQAAANPFPYNLAAMASVAAATASIVANIKSVADVGFATGGYTGNMGRADIAGVVHGQEYVLNAAATKRIGVDTLNALNSGGSLGDGGGNGTIVNINHDPSLVVESRDDGMGNIDVYISKAVEQSWDQLQNPNSKQSKLLQRNFNTARKR
ncbi:hypothetical protein Q5X44_18180, partial [Acinetobacter baumannii]|nr:hypothetical protein [Acinetobacter baumannii]